MDNYDKSIKGKTASIFDKNIQMNTKKIHAKISTRHDSIDNRIACITV